MQIEKVRMKYIVIGDTHGKLEIVEHFLSSEYKDVHKVFIGDYVDSFDRSIDDQVSIVRMLLRSVKDRDDVTCLIGNHELSYLEWGMRSSGYKAITDEHMKCLKDEIFEHFKTHLYITDELLVTHAGATVQVFKTKEEIKEALVEGNRSLYNIGRARGGIHNHGGIFWCDYWTEFQPIPDLMQIVGHSAYRPEGEPEGIVERVGCYNIDCLDRVREVLEVDVIEDGYTIEAIKFMED